MNLMNLKFNMDKQISDLKVKIFADGADIQSIRKLYSKQFISGFTTNPTLMRHAGIADYKTFAMEVLQIIKDRPVSFEVFADELTSMEAQAMEIASWGANVNVKIPVTNTQGVSTVPLVHRLSSNGVVCNITAMFTLEQVQNIVDALNPDTPAILSIFAGRIADTGTDPVPLLREAIKMAGIRPKAEVLWASPRELLNIFQADDVGCHIITVTPNLLKKLDGVGKNLNQFSRETVAMFFNDAKSAGYSIEIPS